MSVRALISEIRVYGSDIWIRYPDPPDVAPNYLDSDLVEKTTPGTPLLNIEALFVKHTLKKLTTVYIHTTR